MMYSSQLITIPGAAQLSQERSPCIPSMTSAVAWRTFEGELGVWLLQNLLAGINCNILYQLKMSSTWPDVQLRSIEHRCKWDYVQTCACATAGSTAGSDQRPSLNWSLTTVQTKGQGTRAATGGCTWHMAMNPTIFLRLRSLIQRKGTCYETRRN